MADHQLRTSRGDTERARASAQRKSEKWTAEQAERLGVTPEEILAAVRRGWLPEDILAATSKYQLEDVPLCAEMREAIEKIKSAPTMPLRSAPPRRDSGRNSWRREQSKPSGAAVGPRGSTGPTAMAEAFKQAAE